MNKTTPWREHSLWLTALKDSLPESLKSPVEAARSETEWFADFHCTGPKPAFSFVLEESLGETYILEQPEEQRFIIRGGKTGILYGTYEVLFDLILKKPIPTGIQKPWVSLRMLDSWDNPEGTIERGYSGRSLWFEDGAFSYDPFRIRQLGRILASVGINVLCINNVNADASARPLIGDLLPEVSEFAEILRPFGVRLMLSVDYSSPMFLPEERILPGMHAQKSENVRKTGPLLTADPLDADVRRWWKERAARVYEAIPDLAGFLVKADSEHRPGPAAYGRNHAQGANMLAEALAPYGGVLVWRAFVYNCRQDWRDTVTDRPCAAYDLYHPLDGEFADNVILQVKNGPYDFQVREPVSPLLAGMKNTNLSLELQLTQEYTGHQIDLFSMPPVWQDVFKDLDNEKIQAAAGVSNLGRDANWTGHPFAALNLFAFGKYTWAPARAPKEIIREWILLSGYRGEEALAELLFHSSSVYEKYTAPLGLCWMVNPGEHYGPSPWGYEFQAWGTYNRADRNSVGIDRTARGTGFTKQYPPDIAGRYEDPHTCPAEYLLFFHRLPYTFRMQDGRTLIQRIYDDHFEGYEETVRMQQVLQELSLPEKDRTEVEERMKKQVMNAREWCDVTNTFFYRLSGIPDEKGRKIYD